MAAAHPVSDLCFNSNIQTIYNPKSADKTAIALSDNYRTVLCHHLVAKVNTPRKLFTSCPFFILLLAFIEEIIFSAFYSVGF